MKNIKSFKAVIFDFDDTLVNTFEVRKNALIETGNRFYNLEVTVEQIKKLWGMPYLEVLERVFNGIESGEEINKKYRTIVPKYPTRLHTGVAKLLDYLSANAILAGIVTAAGKDILEHDMKLIDFPSEKFFMIQTADDTNFHKPDPRVFDPIFGKLQKMKINKSEIVYIGDSLKDFEASRDAGFDFLGVCTGTTLKEEFEKVGAEVVNSLLEIIQGSNRIINN